MVSESARPLTELFHSQDSSVTSASSRLNKDFVRQSFYNGRNPPFPSGFKGVLQAWGMLAWTSLNLGVLGPSNPENSGQVLDL